MGDRQRFALGLSYQGTAYHGWQTQDNLPCVQTLLEEALSRVAAHPVSVICAGRTDAGVHASEQIIHFDTEAVRDEYAWLMGTNSYLPPDISVQWVKAVSANFHARLRATSRCYRYVIYNSPIRPGILHNAVTWHYRALNVVAMHEAAQHWVGEHDFSSFRSSVCQAKTPQRQIHTIEIHQQQSLIVIEVIGNAFLHHMVRNMVGVLFLIGQGFKKTEWALEVLEAKDRRVAGMMAPANGLYLTKISYPAEFGLPITPNGPFFLAGSLL
ncbi:MAG TPA: tRNA pseudouridine(38-40) synthase TruA [Coxiellaceae bacterium]|nr:tRNA pseudouridine(38-40) synthase TruA [Coxiellaceae bacterium]